MAKVFLRTEFNYDMAAASEETGLACRDPSRTVQSERDEADINVIMERVLRTGEMPRPRIPLPILEMPTDFSYQDAWAMVEEAEASFMALPAKVRSRFANDPMAFADFCSDPANIDELRELGLAEPAIISPVEPAKSA